MKKNIVIAAALSLFIGLLLGRCASNMAHQGTVVSQASAHEEIWTCSMHPQIRQSHSGKCPICGMDLIPAGTGGSEEAGPRELILSEAAQKLAEVETAPVERHSVAAEIRLTGKVKFDETRLAVIAPRVAGRIDRLYANFTGVPVKAGDPLADLYSPELFSAQQELITAKTLRSAEGSNSLLAATRERLRLWGLTAEQIAGIEQSGQVKDHITFYSPISGVVVGLEAREGMYVDAGMKIFTVADLSQVWVQLDAYETDLALLRDAQAVELQAEAWPGETFKGTIAFIEPVLDPMTRTVKVRVAVPNLDGRLKPEMFVRATVKAQAGKGTELPLVIPASAPLVTGKRAVVYVAVPERTGVFEGRDVVLGPRAGDSYVVLSGLSEGEQVVTRGNFKIDSSLQIQGKPSMMSPQGGATPVVQQHGGTMIRAETGTEKSVADAVPIASRQQLGKVLDSVLGISDALAGDQFEAALAGVAQAAQALAEVSMSGLSGDVHVRWMQTQDALKKALNTAGAAKDTASIRTAFATLSAEMSNAAKQFGIVQSAPIQIFHCPMAFDSKGANWLQRGTDARNPYFGQAMLSCGELIETIPAAIFTEGRRHE